MEAPGPHPNELERLDTLAALDLEETSSDAALSAATRIAARVFGVPITAIGFVAERRVRFKSSFGLVQSEISRDVSFCGHAILSPDVFVVEDATCDRRFF